MAHLYTRRLQSVSNALAASASDSSPREPIGTIVWVPTDTSTPTELIALRYVYNGESSDAFAAKDLVMAKASATTVGGVSHHAYYSGVAVNCTSAILAWLVLGVVRYAMAAGTYGYVTAWGRCTATAAGAISAGVAIVSAANEDVDTVGSNDGRFAIGFCITAAGGAGDVDVMMRLPNLGG